MGAFAKTCLFLVLVGLTAAEGPPSEANVLQERNDRTAKEWAFLPKAWPSLDSFWKSLLEGLRPHKDDRRWNGHDVDGFRPRVRPSLEEDSIQGRGGQEASALKSSRTAPDTRFWGDQSAPGFLSLEGHNPQRVDNPHRLRREIPVAMEEDQKFFFNGWNGLDVRGYWKPESTKRLHEDIQLRSKRFVKDEVEDELDYEDEYDDEDEDEDEVKKMNEDEEEEVSLSRAARQVPWFSRASNRFRPVRFYRRRYTREIPQDSALRENHRGQEEEEQEEEQEEDSEPEPHSRTVRVTELKSPTVDTKRLHDDEFRPSRYYRHQFAQGVPSVYALRKENHSGTEDSDNSEVLESGEVEEIEQEDAEEPRSDNSVVVGEDESRSRTVREAQMRKGRFWPNRRFIRRRFGREASSVVSEPESHSRTVREAARSSRPHVDTRTWEGYDLDGFRPNRRFLRRRLGREASSPVSEPEKHSRTIREARSSRPHVDTRMWNGYDLDGFRPNRRFIRRRFGREVSSVVSKPELHSRTVRQASRSSRPHVDARIWKGHDLDGFRPNRRFLRRRLGHEASSAVSEPENHNRTIREARSSRPHVDTRLWNGYDLDGFRPNRRVFRRRFGRAASSVVSEPETHSRTVREAARSGRPHVDTRLWDGYDLHGFRPNRRFLRRRLGREASSVVSEPESHSRTVREARMSRPHVDTRMWNGHDQDGIRP